GLLVEQLVCVGAAGEVDAHVDEDVVDQPAVDDDGQGHRREVDVLAAGGGRWRGFVGQRRARQGGERQSQNQVAAAHRPRIARKRYARLADPPCRQPSCCTSILAPSQRTLRPASVKTPTWRTGMSRAVTAAMKPSSKRPTAQAKA